MKAAYMTGFGAPEVIQYGDVEMPEVSSNGVLIKVLAAGMNRIDHYLRNGDFGVGFALPHILGSDAAGEVVAVGSDVTDFKVGDRVIPLPGYPLAEGDHAFLPMSAAPSYGIVGVARPGTHAHYLSVPAQYVVPDATGLAPELIATLPMVMVTTVRAVKVVGAVKSGDRVVVLGGASGTGGMAIQVARALGATVAATTRGAEKADFVRSMGAELVIDTTKTEIFSPVMEWTEGRGADVVIDNLGGDFTRQSLSAVKPLGIVVTIGFVAGLEVGFNIRDFFFTQKQLRGSLMGDQADLQWGLEQVRLGNIRPALDRVLPLSEAQKAHQLVAESALRGNIVLNPWE